MCDAHHDWIHLGWVGPLGPTWSAKHDSLPAFAGMNLLMVGVRRPAARLTRSGRHHMTDQYTVTNPVTQYTSEDFPKQQQEGPGLDSNLTPKADHGEDSYRGSDRLVRRKPPITGADSGIGRAAAIAFAREGADVVLSYLPEEQSDAEEVA